MSNNENFDLDLDKLFQPAWAQDKIEQQLVKKFGGGGDDRPPRRFDERSGDRRGPRREQRGPQGQGQGRRGGLRDRKPGGRRGDDRREQRVEHREPPAPLPDIQTNFIPAEEGVIRLAQQIKQAGRAYPLFQVAQLLLDKAECYNVELKPTKSSQSLFVCALDESPWAKENEAVLHVLKNHLATFYQAEKTPTEPPKGVYTFVAQCGISGVVLGPPNYHGYQAALLRLHEERFSRMPFEAFKTRVKISKDEVLLKQWLEEQSFKTEYVCLNVAEPLRLASLDEVNKHFREVHKDYIIKRVESCVVPGVPSRRLACDGLQRLIRRDWDQLKRFPLPFATKLSQQLSAQGLQFFKVNKAVTHVNVARPKYLDLEAAPVSDGIKRIVEFLNANHKKCNRRKLLSALAPVRKQDANDKPAEAATAEAEAKPAAVPELTPEQQAVLTDLHWLIHQGHVLEFANGRMEAAQKPAAQKKAEATAKTVQQVEVKPENPAETPAETGGEAADDGLIISE
ncbi:MAG: hypothetical protein LBH01_08130 [Verrucomicrobiales bacterium]|jgi:hypothetical protein|nr:hypothetical protein [Verrucomicrobiales bacterium]